MFNIRLTETLVLAMVLAFSITSYTQKMSPEDVVAKHIDSIGTKEKRAQIKSQLVAGNVQFILQGSASKVNGKAIILSSGEKNLWGINLASNDYPQERFGYNGKETKVGFSRPGAYSDLGRFIRAYQEILKEGLLGGTLSSSWALLKTDLKKPKLSYEGTKKIEGKDAFILSYAPKGSSDLSIKMFFDKQSYQHLRTEYNVSIAAGQGATVDTSAGLGESRYRLVEDFSDFKKAGALTLPSTYKLSYSFFNGNALQLARNPNRELELKFNMTAFSYNDPFGENAFDIDAK